MPARPAASTSRISASSKAASSALNEIDPATSSRREPGHVHLGRDLHDGADVQGQHHAEKWFPDTGTRDMRDDREIDRRQHGLPRTVVNRLAAEQNLLVTLRDDAEAQVVDAVERFGWRTASVQRQRRNGGVVVAVGLGKAPDGASEDVRCRNIGRFCPVLASPP